MMNRLRFAAAAADIQAEYAVNGRRSAAHVARRLRLHLTPWFSGRQMTDITSSDVLAFTQARLKAGASNAEINRELAILKRMYSPAIKGKRLHSDARPDVPMLRSTMSAAGSSIAISSTP
jgi:hypothetical protein